MAEEFSWEGVVDRYFEVYERAFETRFESLNAQNI